MRSMRGWVWSWLALRISYASSSTAFLSKITERLPHEKRCILPSRIRIRLPKIPASSASSDERRLGRREEMTSWARCLAPWARCLTPSPGTGHSWHVCRSCSCRRYALSRWAGPDQRLPLSPTNRRWEQPVMLPVSGWCSIRRPGIRHRDCQRSPDDVIPGGLTRHWVSQYARPVRRACASGNRLCINDRMHHSHCCVFLSVLNFKHDIVFKTTYS